MLAVLIVGGLQPLAVNGLQQPQQQQRDDWRQAVELTPLPLPDLSNLEAAVSEQLTQVQELATDVITNSADVAAVQRALVLLARTYHAYDLPGPAGIAYANALRLYPTDFESLYLLGRLLQESGQLEEAAKQLEKAQEVEPSYVANLIAQGAISHALEFAQIAEGFYRHALQLEPKSAAALAGLGEIALTAKRPAEALALYRQALDFVPEATRLHYPLALAYRALGDLDAAQRHMELRGEVGVAPADPILEEVRSLRSGERTAIIRGRLAFQAARFEEAAAAFRIALEAQPDSITARVDLAAAVNELGDRERAAELLIEVLLREPDNQAANYNLGTLLATSGRHDEALPRFRRVLDVAPDDAEARAAYLRSLRGAGQLEEALSEVTAEIEKRPLDADLRLQEAAILIELQRFSEARKRLEDALVSLPSNGALSHALARLLAGSPLLDERDGARALDLAQRVYTARPTAEHALTLALALAESGRCSEAADWQNRAIEALDQAGVDASRPRQQLAKYTAGPPCR